MKKEKKLTKKDDSISTPLTYIYPKSYNGCKIKYFTAGVYYRGLVEGLKITNKKYKDTLQCIGFKYDGLNWFYTFVPVEAAYRDNDLSTTIYIECKVKPLQPSSNEKFQKVIFN